MKPTFRVIFDRSAFHGSNFESLRDSSLKRLCGAGIIAVFHTPNFLNETLGAFGARRETVWQEHLRFAVEVCNGGIFLEKEEIWHEELMSGRGQLARRLLPKRPSRRFDSAPRVLAKLAAKAATGDLSVEWRETQAARDEAYEKTLNQRLTATGMRQEVAKAMREGGVKGNLSDASFPNFRRSTRKELGAELMPIVSKTRASKLASMWFQNQSRYPYYSAFVDGLQYSLFRAAAEHERSIDRNAQADFEQLGYLTWADMIVTNETKFMRDAFDVIWRPRGKRIETAQGFAELVGKLDRAKR